MDRDLQELVEEAREALRRSEELIQQTKKLVKHSQELMRDFHIQRPTAAQSLARGLSA